MTAGDIAGLIAAGVFAVLVALLAIPILKLGRVFDELRIFIRDLNDETEPLLEEVTRTVATTNTQLEKVDVITDSVSDASANVSAMTSLVASTVGQPLIKTAAFSSGVRRAFSADAVRARREERRRAHAAQTAGQAPEGASAPGAAAERTAEPAAQATARTHAGTTADSAAGTGDRTAWWEGTEWDTAARSAEGTAAVDAGIDAGVDAAQGTADETMDPVIIEPDADPARDRTTQRTAAPRAHDVTDADSQARTPEARPEGPGGRHR